MINDWNMRRPVKIHGPFALLMGHSQVVPERRPSVEDKLINYRFDDAFYERKSIASSEIGIGKLLSNHY